MENQIVSSAAYAPPSKIQVLYGPVKTFMNRFSEALNLSYNIIGITCTHYVLDIR